MKPSQSLFLLAAGFLCLAGCSSVKTNVDSGPIHARTFSFLNNGAKPAPSYADNRAEVHAKIQEAITKNLAGKGVTRVPNGGDLIVAYLVIVANNASTMAVSEYFGYTNDSYALLNKAHDSGGSQRGYYESGTLVIDVLDAKTNKLLKRSSVQRQLLRNLPVEARVERLNEAVAEAFKDLRVSP